MTNSTTIYQPTLMQRLLGRNYKWWYIMQYNFKLAFNDRLGLLVTVIRFTLPLLITILIYSSFQESKNLTGELSLSNYLFQITAMAFGISWDLRFNIIKGGLSNKLLQPTDYINSQLAVALGFSTFTFILRTLVYIPILIYSGSHLILSSNLILAILRCVISFLSYLWLEIVVGSCAFWFNVASNRILEIYYDLIPLLAGAIILLQLNSTTRLISQLPFAIAAYHPMQIYLGKYDLNQTMMVFAGGIVWCFVLYFLAKWVFAMGLKRNEAVGL
jgi:ABC-type uncharacterized transport system permease subunit